MFTGLIEATGTIEAVKPTGNGRRARINSTLGAELRAGDSIAVNGVCLTAVDVDRAGFTVDISPETRRVTTLDALAADSVVNLERPLRADSRLGGHFVLGHVDGVGRIASIDSDGECYWLTVDAPAELARYLISKGSIAIDGISLTIARLDRVSLAVQIVPFTWQHTALSGAKAGDRVNLEVDVLGKYVERLLNENQVAAR